MWRQERDIENLSSGRSIACLLIPHRCRRQRPSWRGTQVRRLRQAREPAREDNNPRAGGAAWGAYLDPRRQTGSGSGSRRAARGGKLLVSRPGGTRHWSSGPNAAGLSCPGWHLRGVCPAGKVRGRTRRTASHGSTARSTKPQTGTGPVPGPTSSPIHRPDCVPAGLSRTRSY